jgi:hypothetical protein
MRIRYAPDRTPVTGTVIVSCGAGKIGGGLSSAKRGGAMKL